MLLLPVERATWDILAICGKDGSCELLDFLGDLNKKYHGSRASLMALIRRISQDNLGPRLLPVEICHALDKKNKIWEFIAGDIRLLWFYSEREKKVIICSHAMLKKSQQTKPAEIARAVAAKKSYEEAWRKNQVQILQTREGNP